MNKTEKQKLLNDKRVVEEIRRHLWIESEKAGCDIGFDRAQEDWLKNFSKAWMAYHLPDGAPKKRSASRDSSKGESSKPQESVKAKGSSTSPSKKRRAKSYVE